MERILDELADERIFSVRFSENKRKLILLEECDQFFQAELSKKAAIQMIEELKRIVSNMEGEA